MSVWVKRRRPIDTDEKSVPRPFTRCVLVIMGSGPLGRRAAQRSRFRDAQVPAAPSVSPAAIPDELLIGRGFAFAGKVIAPDGNDQRFTGVHPFEPQVANAMRRSGDGYGKPRLMGAVRVPDRGVCGAEEDQPTLLLARLWRR